VLDRFFSGIPHPHLLGDLAPDLFYSKFANFSKNIDPDEMRQPLQAVSNG
jgi:hypothetical protein